MGKEVRKYSVVLRETIINNVEFDDITFGPSVVRCFLKGEQLYTIPYSNLIYIKHLAKEIEGIS